MTHEKIWLLLVVTLLTVSGAASIRNWKLGIGLSLGIGLLQDPIRKVFPGQPAWLTLALLPILACSALGLLRSNTHVRKVIGVARTLTAAGAVTVFFLSVASLIGVARANSANELAAIVLGWIGPFAVAAGITLGIHSGSTRSSRITWLGVWTFAVTLMLTGHLLEHLIPDPQPSLVGPLPPNRPWYHTFEIAKFRMTAGFFRSPENAGWYAGTVAALAVGLFSLQVGSRRIWPLVWLPVGGYAMFCCLLDARRKMQVMALISIMVLLILTLINKNRATSARCAMGLIVVGSLAGFGTTLLPGPNHYLSFFASSASDLPHRASAAIGSGMRWSLEQAGLFGYGLGSITPGNQHVGASPPVYVEGGLLKIAVEGGWFGVTGFLITGFLLVAAGCQSFRKSAFDSRNQTLATILFGSTIGSFACFLMGHQVFGDPAVLTTAGWLFGMGLACGFDSSWADENERMLRVHVTTGDV